MVHISQRTVRRMQRRKQDAYIRRQHRLSELMLQTMMSEFQRVRSIHDQGPALDIPQMSFGKPDNAPWHYDYKTEQCVPVPKKGWWSRNGAFIFLASVAALYLGWIGLNIYWSFGR